MFADTLSINVFARPALFFSSRISANAIWFLRFEHIGCQDLYDFFWVADLQFVDQSKEGANTNFQAVKLVLVISS